MLIGPGKHAAPGDAVDLLLECHTRIRHFLALARRLGEARGESPTALAGAAGQVHRYFTLALPLHAQDEEESIAPRLKGRDAALDAELDAMTREHREHQRPLGMLVAACAEVAGDPGRLVEVAGVLLRATAELEVHFAEHLAREEQVILPAVRRLLDVTTREGIVSEMRGRRSGADGVNR